MGSLGLPEVIFILLLALLIFGPKRLPEIGRTLGKGMAEFRKASNDLKRTINAELSLDEDEQTRHPRRIESPVPSIVQAMAPGYSPGYSPQAEPTEPAIPATPTQTLSQDPSAPEPPTYHELPVAEAPWTPKEPPAGTVPQGSQSSQISQVSPIVTPAPAGSPADPHADLHETTPPSTAPIEPS